jgi:PAS domain S-box-containing protein
MSFNNRASASRPARTVAVACASTVLAVCVLVLVGWAFGIPLLRRGFVGPELVRPNAAVALFFAALSVLLLRRRVGRALAAVPFVIGALTLIEYVAGADIGIDAMLFDPGPGVDVRMSVRGAVAAAFAGLAGLFAPYRTIALTCAAVTGFMGLLSSTTYVYGAQFLPHMPVSHVALSTAILCILWTVAFVAAGSGHGPVAAFLLGDRWGATARQLSLIAILVPVILGAIFLLGLDRGLFDTAFTVALITTASSVTLVCVISIYTSRLRAAESLSREADAMYRSIVETSHEGICVLDPSQHVTFVNQHFATMIGYQPHELIGRHASSLVVPEERQAVADRAVARQGEQSATRTELRLQHRQGLPVYAISSAIRLGAESNLEGYVLGTLSDITDRVKAEHELRASEARFRSVYDSNLIGVAFWTFERNIVQANDALRQILSIADGELPGWSWSSRNTEEGHEFDARLIAELRERGRCGPVEKELKRPDGSSFWILMALARIDGETNVAFVIDITERIEARLQLERAHEILSARVQQLEGGERLEERSDEHVTGGRELGDLASRLSEAHDELETFSYSVSHDLRAPLRAIDGFSRELQTGYEHCLDETGQHYLRRVRTATQRMSLLIDDLLSLSRLSRQKLRRTSVDVSALATDVAAEMTERAGREIGFDIAPNLIASADPHLLRVVFENILGNAVKFSSRRERAHIEVFDAGDGELAVRDNGAGFDARFVDKIFAPFQRLHSSEFEGTGIGLALVQRIIRRHGGTIRAESAPDQGATFFFTLPPPGDPAT